MVLSQVQTGTSNGDGISLFTNSKITTLTNDGTISATTGTSNGRGIGLYTSEITTLTNNDTISATAGTIMEMVLFFLVLQK